MQLKTTLSLITCTLLSTASLMADDYVSVQYVHYDEDSGRTTIHTPAIEVSKDFGVDYNLKLSFVHDALSGASPTWYDSSSGATATLPEGTLYKNDIVYGNIPYDDKRNALGMTLTTRFASRDELRVGVNYSDENDYTARELSAEYLHYLDSSKNRSLSVGVSYQDNDVSVYCYEETCDSSSGGSAVSQEDINVLSAEIGVTQILDATSWVSVSLFYSDEEGYLSNPYMSVVRDYATSVRLTPEHKPDTRTAYGMLLQYAKALDDQLSAQVSYRFYDDDWDITSHTLKTEFYYEWTQQMTLGAGLRYYVQSEASFYSSRKDFFTNEIDASSDRRMSSFDAYNLMLLGTYKVQDNVSINAGVNYYDQGDYFSAWYYTLGFTYSF